MPSILDININLSLLGLGQVRACDFCYAMLMEAHVADHYRYMHGNEPFVRSM